MYNGLPVNFGHLPSLFTYLLVSKKDNSKSLRIKLAYTGNIHHLKFTTFNKKKKKTCFLFPVVPEIWRRGSKNTGGFSVAPHHWSHFHSWSTGVSPFHCCVWVGVSLNTPRDWTVFRTLHTRRAVHLCESAGAVPNCQGDWSFWWFNLCTN